MIQTLCCWFMIISAVGTFIKMVKWDIEGRPSLEPAGFPGVMGSICAILIYAALLYGAGVLDHLNPPKPVQAEVQQIGDLK